MIVSSVAPYHVKPTQPLQAPVSFGIGKPENKWYHLIGRGFAPHKSKAEVVRLVDGFLADKNSKTRKAIDGLTRIGAVFVGADLIDDNAPYLDANVSGGAKETKNFWDACSGFFGSFVSKWFTKPLYVAVSMLKVSIKDLLNKFKGSSFAPRFGHMVPGQFNTPLETEEERKNRENLLAYSQNPFLNQNRSLISKQDATALAVALLLLGSKDVGSFLQAMQVAKNFTSPLGEFKRNGQSSLNSFLEGLDICSSQNQLHHQALTCQLGLLDGLNTLLEKVVPSHVYLNSPDKRLLDSERHMLRTITSNGADLSNYNNCDYQTRQAISEYTAELLLNPKTRSHAVALLEELE